MTKKERDGYSEADLLAFLDGMEVASPIRDGEITAEDAAARWDVSGTTARKKLDAQIRAGKMTRRKAVKGGRLVYAYSLK